MNKYLKFFWLYAAVAILTFVSCDTEEEEETSLSMNGSFNFDLPTYVFINDVRTLTASGIIIPETYATKWLISDIYEDTLVGKTITVSFPDTIGTYSVSAIASAADYYSVTTSKTVTTIDPSKNGSLVGVDYGDTMFTDPRDLNKYYITKVGNLEWFAQNLAWNGAGVSYRRADATQALFGRFYSWNEATGGVSSSGLGAGPQGVCPKGWSVPTDEDWADFGKALNEGEEVPFNGNWKGLGEKVTVQAYFNGDIMWPYSPDNNKYNTFKWNALPIGNSQLSNSSFKGFSEYGFWWSSTEQSDTKAYYKYIYYDQSSFPTNYTGKDDFGASVRCVRLIKK